MHSPWFGGFAEVEQRMPAVHLIDAFNFYCTDQVNSTRRLDDPYSDSSSDMQVDYYYLMVKSTPKAEVARDNRKTVQN